MARLIVIARVLVLLSLTLGSGSANTSDTFITIDEAPPLGFEHIDELNHGYVDVFWGGQFIISTLATYNSERLNFVSPEKIIEKIPALISPEKALKLLLTELDTHSDLLCKERKVALCGQLKNSESGIIADISTLRIDVFFAQDLLKEQYTDKLYLADSNAGLSFLLPLSASSSTDFHDKKPSYHLNGDLTASYGNTHVKSRWNKSSTNQFQAQDFYLRHDHQGKEIRLGIFDTVGFGGGELTNNTLISGFRYASTTRTRTSINTVVGSKIQVLLNTASRIDIYKDDRLISSKDYPSGNQVINTDSLPQGSYDITLKIYPNSGTVRVEKHFFNKSHQLPPHDQPLYFLSGGQIYSRSTETILPTATQDSLIRAGYFTQLTDQIAPKIILSFTQEQSMIQLSSIFVLPRFQLSTSALMTNTQDTGFGLSLNSTISNVFLSASIHNNKLGTQPINNSEFRLIASDINRYSASAIFPIKQGSLNLSYTNTAFNKNTITEDNQVRWSANFNHPLLTSNKHSLNFNARYYFTDDQENYYLGLSYRLFQNNWNHLINASYQDTEGSDLAAYPMNFSSQWDDNDLYKDEISTSMAYNTDANDIDKGTLSAGLGYSSNLGSVRFHANKPINNDNNTNYNTQVSTSIAGNLHSISFGSIDSQESAVIVRIDSDISTSEAFEVYIDGQLRDYAKTNRSSIITLDPYKTHTVEITPPKGSNYKHKSSFHRFVTYPGNVYQVTLDVSRTYSVYGQIINRDGTPFSDAHLEGSQNLEGTNEYGIFQVEVDSKTSELLFATKYKKCKVIFSKLDPKKPITSLGKLICGGS